MMASPPPNPGVKSPYNYNSFMSNFFSLGPVVSLKIISGIITFTKV